VSNGITAAVNSPGTASRPLWLVLGASGYIGTHLVERLAREDIKLRASGRNRRVLEARGWQDVELIEADALRPETLASALAGAEVAYYLVHSMAAGRKFGRLDLTAASNFARAAGQAGLQRIVYLGGLVPAHAASEHIVSRRETGEVLRHGSVPVTELRAGIIVGPGSAAFEVMRDLVFHLPLMITPRWVRAKSPPIGLANLLEYLVQVAQLEETSGRTFDAAGPQTLSYQQMMNVLAEEAGRRPPWVIPVPVLSPRLSSYWLKLVTAVPTNVARALIEGLRHDLTAEDAELRRLIPQHLLDFRGSVRAALEAERETRVATRWTEGAFAMRKERPDYAYYAKRASGRAMTAAPPAAVWRVVAAIGGHNRYYYLDSLWTLRELMDWMLGGPGLQHGRRHPTDLRVGDTVDSWRVIGLEPERRLTLSFGMKAPGAGVLEFELEPLAKGGTRLVATAYWHPAGVWGLLYWYALEPAHRMIFDGMTREICRRAEREIHRPA
jgi:uncharacterized protein YbjT (DUF2867 family)/uncharacterized protein YndB with AHSA1/START domain